VTPRASPTKPRSIARHGLLVIAGLLGVGLLAMSYTSYRSVQTLADILTQSPSLSGEFEPTFAARHVSRAKATFALGTGASILLVAVAAVLWLRARREEELSLRLLQSERLAGLGTVSAVLAHEIRNPLAALKGNAQLVAENLPEGTRPRAQADRVVAAAVRLEDLVNNLLDFARGGTLRRAEVDPAELLYNAAEDAAPKAHLELDAAPEAWSLDAVHMRQVLANLLRNAAQAAGDEARVWASASVEDGRLLFIVRDEGPGLPEGSFEAIFEPFFTTKTRGVGLGLAVARRIVVQHGGQITARNRREGGAEFRISIPPG
jgi:two-component system sensor histidine kinase HydH